jgi:hypothetical protein
VWNRHPIIIAGMACKYCGSGFGVSSSLQYGLLRKIKGKIILKINVELILMMLNLNVVTIDVTTKENGRYHKCIDGVDNIFKNKLSVNNEWLESIVE